VNVRVLFAVSFEKNPNRKNGVVGAGALDEAGLVARYVDDGADSRVNHAFEQFHGVAQQSNGPVIGAVGHVALVLPDWHRGAG